MLVFQVKQAPSSRLMDCTEMIMQIQEWIVSLHSLPIWFAKNRPKEYYCVLTLMRGYT